MLQFSCRFALLSTVRLSNRTPKLYHNTISKLTHFLRHSVVIAKCILLILPTGGTPLVRKQIPIFWRIVLNVRTGGKNNYLNPKINWLDIQLCRIYSVISSLMWILSSWSWHSRLCSRQPVVRWSESESSSSGVRRRGNQPRCDGNAGHSFWTSPNQHRLEVCLRATEDLLPEFWESGKPVWLLCLYGYFVILSELFVNQILYCTVLRWILNSHFSPQLSRKGVWCCSATW